MGRVTGYISNEVESKLIDLKNLININHVDIESISYKDGLKYTILNDPYIKIKSSGNAEFEIEAQDNKVIAEAMLSDFIMGHERRKEQYKNLQRLIIKGEDYNPAWPLITAYYCAFFCALDISKTLSKVNINFDKQSMDTIKRKATGDISGLEDATNFSGTIAPQCRKIKFTSTRQKPHAYAWDNLYQAVIKKALKKHADWEELNTLKNILHGINRWEIPSNIRNEWNYIDPFLFRKKGNDLGKEFKKVIGRTDSAEHWLVSNYTSNGKTHHAGSIAILCEILFKASNDAYQNIFID